MSRQQIIVVVIGVLLIVGLYNLPRVVVENETDTELETHDFSVTDQDSEAMNSLRQTLRNEKSGKTVIFADSLARLYLKYGLTDSAFAVVERFMLEDSSFSTLEKTAPLLYTLYERAMTPEEAAVRGVAAREALERLLARDEGNLSVKNKLAMTMVTTERPMVGIQMLREVIAVDPDNREALINLGLLSIRSGQFGRGVERFERLLELEPNDYEAMLFLGVCYQELNKADSANIWFEKIKAAENVDPAIRAAAIEYLEE